MEAKQQPKQPPPPSFALALDVDTYPGGWKQPHETPCYTNMPVASPITPSTHGPYHAASTPTPPVAGLASTWRPPRRPDRPIRRVDERWQMSFISPEQSRRAVHAAARQTPTSRTESVMRRGERSSGCESVRRSPPRQTRLLLVR